MCAQDFPDRILFLDRKSKDKTRHQIQKTSQRQFPEKDMNGKPTRSAKR
jgi:hypothetical protein